MKSSACCCVRRVAPGAGRTPPPRSATEWLTPPALTWTLPPPVLLLPARAERGEAPLREKALWRAECDTTGGKEGDARCSARDCACPAAAEAAWCDERDTDAKGGSGECACACDGEAAPSMRRELSWKYRRKREDGSALVASEEGAVAVAA